MQKYKRGGVELGAASTFELLRRFRRRMVAWCGYRCGRAKFQLDGKAYPFYLHSYNQTWSNERSVEISLARNWMNQHSTNLLEVGNVLSHYGFLGHEVIDKYEYSEITHVYAEDFLTFQPSAPYQAIISISTIEHIGRDETDEMQEKAISALNRIPEILISSGVSLVTFAAGYNDPLDLAAVEMGQDSGSGWHTTCLRRVARFKWTQVGVMEGLNAHYGEPFPCGNCLFVMQYAKS